METQVNHSTLTRFCVQIARARKLKGLPELHHHDLAMFAQTLINGASLFQLIASMECSDRFDLVEDSDSKAEKGTDILRSEFKDFAEQYLGLELDTQGDPRGAVFKLVVDPSIGDSFGSKEHLCVPCNDAYFCA